MLDRIEYRIANKLAEHHNYPYAQNIYINIFSRFSHFPLKLHDIGIKGEGNTITFMALVVLSCFDHKTKTFPDLYSAVLQKLKKQAASFFPQDIVVETFLGCILYYYHPANIKNILSTIEVSSIFNPKELYEYELKKKTILLFMV